MPSVAVLAADGFETIECLTMVDVMRHARLDHAHARGRKLAADSRNLRRTL